MTDSLVAPRSLVADVAAYRADLQMVRETLGAARLRIERLEPSLHALMPEPDRWGRLDGDAGRIESDGALLFGALLGVKDIIRVDGLPTTAGSRLPPDLFAGAEASVVTRLKAGGALVLGKTVTAEFAVFQPGPTANPHDPARTPGGSSSGSAAAVAAGYCPLALGTQTIGSVTRPAAFCGVVGFTPTRGRVPGDGIIPCSPSLDAVGCFTADVPSARLAASVLCRDWRQVPAAVHHPTLGVPRGRYLAQASHKGLAAFERQVGVLRAAGYVVNDIDMLDDVQQIDRRHRALMLGEMAAVHADWFARYGDLYGPITADLVRRGAATSSDEMAEGRAGIKQLRAELDDVMHARGIDLWIAPAATGPAPLGLESTGSPVMSLPWHHAGLPALSLPAGAVDGMPVGLQVIGAAGADERILAWGKLLAGIVEPRAGG